ncbi:MAG: hypothetical protein AAF546_11790 [Verrucomicrobiota bacterium]
MKSRAVRIPREWLNGTDEVELERDGDAVVIPASSGLNNAAGYIHPR